MIDGLVMDDVDDFFDAWHECPPVHVSVAVFAGTFRKKEQSPLGADPEAEKDPVMRQLMEKLRAGRK